MCILISKNFFLLMQNSPTLHSRTANTVLGKIQHHSFFITLLNLTDVIFSSSKFYSLTKHNLHKNTLFSNTLFVFFVKTILWFYCFQTRKQNGLTKSWHRGPVPQSAQHLATLLRPALPLLIRGKLADATVSHSGDSCT